MWKTIFNNIVRFVLIILFQVFILSKLGFGSFFSPYFYLMFIILLPFETPKWSLPVIGFITGITIDMFANTPGIHAGATTFIAFIRPYIFSVIQSKKEYEIGSQPYIKDYGFGWFASYSFLMISIHHVIVLSFEAFSFSNLSSLFIRIIASISISFILILICQMFFINKKKLG